MNSFHLSIVSFNQVVFEGDAVYCSVFTPTGMIGFKANHEPFVSVLKENTTIEYQSDSSKKESIEIKNGLFSFDKNICTITVFRCLSST